MFVKHLEMLRERRCVRAKLYSTLYFQVILLVFLRGVLGETSDSRCKPLRNKFHVMRSALLQGLSSEGLQMLSA